MPLRYVAGKLKCAADKVRYTRYKKVVKFIQSGLTADMCESNDALAFKRGWVSLELYLRHRHQACIDTDAAPSSLYETVMKLGDAFEPPLITTLHAAHTSAPRALHEVLHEHMNVLAAAEACSAVSAARQTVMVSQLKSALQPPPKRGRPAALPVQPLPKRGRPAAPLVPAPAVAAADTLNKCCCGVIFHTPASLKRHHDGIGGKLPREPAHPCTAGCTFSSRARK